MALRALQLGDPTSILQNEVFALPAALCQIAATVACEVSVNGTTWVALANEAVTAAAFIRCPTASSIVIAKKAVAGGAQSLLSLALSSPPAPLLDRVLVYVDKNAAGKYRLRARFPSGVSANIVVEP
jgi:hypothetical protein